MVDAAALAGKGETGLETRGRLRRQPPADRHDVAADDRTDRIGERGRERRVSREEQQAGRRAIEAPHGDEAAACVAEDVEHGRTAFRIAARRDGTPRLVERDHQPRPIRLPDDLGVVDRDADRGGHARAGVSHHAAVHADAASPNQADCLSSRRDPPLGEKTGKKERHRTVTVVVAVRPAASRTVKACAPDWSGHGSASSS
jgi:hypothetical protein